MKRFICLAPIALTACGTKEVPVLILPPVELTTCADMPDAPTLPPRDGTEETQAMRDGLTLEYILTIRTAYASCKGAVNGLKAWRESVE